jgi:hypothetical protein
MHEIVCYRCGRNADVRGLFRVNERGVLPAIWACEEHLPAESAPDPEVKEIVNLLERGESK